MQNPKEDTEWNEQLRKHGVLPKKENEVEVKEEDLVKLIEKTVQDRLNPEKQLGKLNLEQLNELEDEYDERVLEQFRRRRIAEMMESAKRPSFGSVQEITAANYVDEVNHAGAGVYVVLHLYKQGIPLCTVINNLMSELSQEYVHTKFLKSISSLCIERYPDDLLPTIFVYKDGQPLAKLVGPAFFANNDAAAIKMRLTHFLRKNKAIGTTDGSDHSDDEEMRQPEDYLTKAIRQGIR